MWDANSREAHEKRGESFLLVLFLLACVGFGVLVWAVVAAPRIDTSTVDPAAHVVEVVEVEVIPPKKEVGGLNWDGTEMYLLMLPFMMLAIVAIAGSGDRGRR